MSYTTFAELLVDTGVLSDPWLDGQPRFREAPVVLTAREYRAVAAAATGIARVHDELARLVLAEPDLVDSYFALTPWQRGMWQCAAPHWHGIARADVFRTDSGIQVCELNSDTPSGAAEAVELGGLATAGHANAFDPNRTLPRRFVLMIEAAAAALERRGPLTIGIVYPTEITEDLSMILVYRRWLEARGHTVVLGSPFNLDRARDGRASVLGTGCDVIVRHYKTDWWGERLPARDDEPLAAVQQPLAAPLTQLLAAQIDGCTAVVNPFGAVLTQNKRALAFCWEHLARFSPFAQAAIRRWLPTTVRLEAAREDLWQARERWVLKSDYGCEGEEVVVGPDVDQAMWEDALLHAIPQRWVAQRCFAAERDAHGDVVNHGVYVIAGRAAGMLARVHGDRTTGHAARIAPVLVAGGAA